MSIANDPEGNFQQTFGVDQSASPGLSNTLSQCLSRNRLIIFQCKINYQQMSIANDPEGIFRRTFVDQSASPGLSNAHSFPHQKQIKLDFRFQQVLMNSKNKNE